MEIYNEEKTEILKNYDLEFGELKEDTLLIHHDEVKGQEEEYHYVTIKEYENGGKDVEKIIDKPFIPHQDEYDEERPILIYIPYSETKIKQIQDKKKLTELKNELASTDYKAIKYAEGWFTEEEYAPIKEYRENLREQIRQLENKLI